MTLRHLVRIVILPLATLFCVAPASGVPSLQGRSISGVAVASDDPSAVFEYDAYQNITWLRDWDYANAAMDWSHAHAWATGLSIGAFDDWTLPEIGQYSALWNVEGSNYLDLQAHFINVLHLFYWSNTAGPSNPPSSWAFFTDTGYQTSFDNSLSLHAVAVRNGDVLTEVPEPQSGALALIAFAACALTMRRQRRK